MKVLVSPDKFKGSLSANEICQIVERGLKRQNKSFEIIAHPMADGGDGSLEILSEYLNLKSQAIQTVDPLGRGILAQYFVSPNAAFIEVASASGIVLLKEDERNPLITSTYGTGKMIADAISKGFQNIYLFLGGSATNDAGIGIASSLGYLFLDEQKRILKPIGENLSSIRYIKPTLDFDLKNIQLILLCDVTNPLVGENGAAYVYAPQKGATVEQVKYLDDGLSVFSQVIYKQFGKNISNLRGGGAAGGIGAGLTALFDAKMKSGFEVIASLTNLEKRIQEADWVISGEGKLDAQSLQGKVIDGVANLCKKYNKPLTLLVGKNDLQTKEMKILGAKYIFSIVDNAKNLQDAIANGSKYLEEIAEKLALILTKKT